MGIINIIEVSKEASMSSDLDEPEPSRTSCIAQIASSHLRLITSKSDEVYGGLDG